MNFILVDSQMAKVMQQPSWMAHKKNKKENDNYKRYKRLYFMYDDHQSNNMVVAYSRFGITDWDI